MTTYTAVARRAGDWWAISVPELKGVHTQSKRLSRVEAMARDAIALFLNVPTDSFDVDVRPEVPDEVTQALAAREAANQAEERAATALRIAIETLLNSGLTVRDAGQLLKLSPARISQIDLMIKAGDTWAIVEVKSTPADVRVKGAAQAAARKSSSGTVRTARKTAATPTRRTARRKQDA